MNFNFFDWIQEGVKRSVLGGVSDAVKILGLPPDEETFRSTVPHFLQPEENCLEATTPRRITSSGGTGKGKPVLGRGIADISK